MILRPPRSPLLPYTTLFRSLPSGNFSFVCRNNCVTCADACFGPDALGVHDPDLKITLTLKRKRNDSKIHDGLTLVVYGGNGLNLGPESNQLEVTVEVDHARTVDVVAEKLLLIALAHYFYRSFYISVVDAALGVESFGKPAHHVSRVPAVFCFVSNLEVKHRDKQLALEMSTGKIVAEDLRMGVSLADLLGRLVRIARRRKVSCHQ